MCLCRFFFFRFFIYAELDRDSAEICCEIGPVWNNRCVEVLPQSRSPVYRNRRATRNTRTGNVRVCYWTDVRFTQEYNTLAHKNARDFSLLTKILALCDNKNFFYSLSKTSSKDFNTSCKIDVVPPEGCDLSRMLRRFVRHTHSQSTFFKFQFGDTPKYCTRLCLVGNFRTRVDFEYSAPDYF